MAGVGLFNPAVIAVALDGIPEEQSGLAAGVNDTARQAGIAVGVAGLGALIPHGSAWAATRSPTWTACTTRCWPARAWRPSAPWPPRC